MNALEQVEIGTTGVKVTRLGMGGVSIGGMYTAVDEKDAITTIRAAADMGMTYFDTAPLYGHGNSEERFGKALEGYPRGSFVISTKVGRLLRDVESPPESVQWKGIKARDWSFDFSRDGVLRSIEGSLKRLNMERVEILYIHDPYDYYKQAMEETYPVLHKLRSEGVVKAIGVGIGGVDELLRFARDGDFDCFLLWGRYSLLDQTALNELLPLCQEKHISIALGAPYESGVLASDLESTTTFRYQEASPEIIQRARRLKDVCDRFDVPLKAAALQFVFGHPTVATVIPGTRSAQRMEENRRMLEYPIPRDLWRDLKAEGLIPDEAPDPS